MIDLVISIWAVSGVFAYLACIAYAIGYPKTTTYFMNKNYREEGLLKIMAKTFMVCVVGGPVSLLFTLVGLPDVWRGTSDQETYEKARRRYPGIEQ